MDKFILKKRQVSGEATCARETPSTSEASSSIEATTTGEPANMSCDDDEAPSPSSNEKEDTVIAALKSFFGGGALNM